ncbi:hypothetical protein J6590_084199 [Homalodisca vitripennis]|nr:hypothetical protein J6590_084199 [Homalodisca vitripennis]
MAKSRVHSQKQNETPDFYPSRAQEKILTNILPVSALPREEKENGKMQKTQTLQPTMPREPPVNAKPRGKDVSMEEFYTNNIDFYMELMTKNHIDRLNTDNIDTDTSSTPVVLDHLPISRQQILVQADVHHHESFLDDLQTTPQTLTSSKSINCLGFPLKKNRKGETNILTILHQNMDSIASKINKLDNLLQKIKPDLVILSEHGLKEDQVLNTRLPGYLLAGGFSRKKL